MNFFQAQDQARKSTRWLVVVYLIATLLIVAGVTLIVAFGLLGSSAGDWSMMLQSNLPLLGIIAASTAALIVISTLIKTATLSSGGAKVALDMGGVPVDANTTDPLRRRFRNVVEEMAIASGVPVPDIFVLEEESSINAFAAGFEPGDAAIAVTRGTLELLNREELQGVVAHEFSHILNGDMRLNIRLMGVLYGIMVLGLLGRVVLRGGYHGSLVSSRRNKNASAILLIGLGLAILGAIGVFFARVIKAAVSRQREYLADASAVQFTRQTDGIANALKKIGGYSESSHIKSRDPEEVSHMLFGTGASFSSIFATHPPLTERIQALDPGFRADDYPVVDKMQRQSIDEHSAASEQVAGFSAAAVRPEAIADAIGQLTPESIAAAGLLKRSIPENLVAAAHSDEMAYLLCVALVVSPDAGHMDRQLVLIEEQLGTKRASAVRGYIEELQLAGRQVRIPLLELAFPALKRRPAPQLEYLVDLLQRLVSADGKTDLYEYCFLRILLISLGEAFAPGRAPRKHKLRRKDVQVAAVNLLAVLARAGSDDEAAARRAFDAGMSAFPKWADDIDLPGHQDDVSRILDASLDTLTALNSDGIQLLLKAVSATVHADGVTTASEIELLRAVCASLKCPLPPLNT